MSVNLTGNVAPFADVRDYTTAFAARISLEVNDTARWSGNLLLNARKPSNIANMYGIGQHIGNLGSSDCVAFDGRWQADRKSSGQLDSIIYYE